VVSGGHDVRTDTSNAIDASPIPVIDIGPLRDGSDATGVARALHRASREVGFLYVSNHGIPEAAIGRARRVALEFFRRPETQKARVRVSPQHRGWLPRGGARMQDDLEADLKESYLWGYEDSSGVSVQDHPLRGSNRWPDFMPGLRVAAMDFFDRAERVAHHLMRGFALGLDKPADFFLPETGMPLSRGSFVYYPPPSPQSAGERFGVGPHTDFGVLTVLCQDDVGGLQVQSPSGQWITAEPIDGTLVVNVGDLLARWTDGEYRSTPHRVVNRSGRERLSLVLAHDPDPRTVIDPRAVFGPHRGTREPPITCGEYLEWRFAKAFAYRRKA
jgi:isopenicillin N synthase-like dioxygenase